MRICYYSTVPYLHNHPMGGYAHIGQFVSQATALGHEVWMWRGGEHPDVKPMPTGGLARLKLLRQMDLIYCRVEWKPPDNVRWVRPSVRPFIGRAKTAWEFNTVPEYAQSRGVPQPAVDAAIHEFKRHAAGVDLAVCVSQGITDYVRDKLGFARVATVPNGSDPDLFRPDVPIVKRMLRKPDQLNVAWIGSADLPWHNFDLLRDAAWSIWNRGEGERIVFHVIGQGMKGLRDAPPNVNYYGPEEYHQLPGWLSAMDVGLNIYRRGPADFSSPLKVFDYMASGMTVVSTDQPQVREIFQQLNQADLLVEGDQPEQLATVLRRLAADPDLRRRQGAASRQLIIDQYNWRRAVRDVFSHLDAIKSN